MRRGGGGLPALPLGLIGPLAGAVLALAMTACGARSSSTPTSSPTSTSANTSTSAHRAHPQSIEPTAGAQAPASGGAAEEITGDPNARAPSLAQVKHELVRLNLCGGASSSAQAQPVVGSSGPGFVADPGTIQSVGHLPVLTARLDALAKALHVTIYGISGYRTPAHSVAVGGFADDPHTKGEAEDIGVGNLLRSSAAQISEGQLARFGLYRPFDPSDDPTNPEVNHVQLIPAGGPVPVAVAEATFAPDPSCK